MPYKVGEEILYKHGDHKDLAIIDKTYYNQDKKALMVDVWSCDDRKETAHLDNIKSADETDISIVLTTDGVEHTKCLIHDELQMIKNPKPLSNI